MRPVHRSSLSLKALFLRRFKRADEGATAVEFALVAPIFFAIIGASMETALVFFAGYALESSVYDTSRLIRTGQAQAMSLAQYKDVVCSRLYNMFDCDELKINVRPIDNFASFAQSSPLDPNTGEWAMSENFQPGTGTNVVVVEAYYKWPTIIAIPALMTGVTADGKRLLGGTRIFKNEPFGVGQ